MSMVAKVLQHEMPGLLVGGDLLVTHAVEENTKEIKSFLPL